MKKEIALKIAKNFGLGLEVLKWQKAYLDRGIDEDKAWDYALMEFDIFPYNKEQLDEFLNQEPPKNYSNRKGVDEL